MEARYCRSVKSLKKESRKQSKLMLIILMISIAMHIIIFTPLIPIKFHSFEEPKEQVNVVLIQRSKMLEPTIYTPRPPEKQVTAKRPKPKSQLKKKKDRLELAKRDPKKTEPAQNRHIESEIKQPKANPQSSAIVAKSLQIKKRSDIPIVEMMEAIKAKSIISASRKGKIVPKAPDTINYTSIESKQNIESGLPKSDVKGPISKHGFSVSRAQDSKGGVGGPFTMEPPDTRAANNLRMPILLNGHQIRPLNPRTIRGRVEIIIKLKIDIDGKPKNIEVIHPKPSYGDPLDDYAKAAVDAARKLRFTPGLKDGKREPVWGRITITFDFSKDKVETLEF